MPARISVIRYWITHGLLAQSGEQRPYKAKAVGSIPTQTTKNASIVKRNNSGFVTQRSWFNSKWGHQITGL